MKQPNTGCFIIYQLLFILLSGKEHIIPAGYFLPTLIAFATDI
jgi:hypothetical protein